jgi:hypothetical protein
MRAKFQVKNVKLGLQHVENKGVTETAFRIRIIPTPISTWAHGLHEIIDKYVFTM